MRWLSMRWVAGKWLVLAWALAGSGSLAFGQPSPNLKMGNPSGAQADPNQPDNYLLDRTYFVTSYNNSKGTPNWVSWRLAATDLGRAPRDNFYADPDLPAGFLQVDPAEYTGSGFDRGHMCPHGDRTATVTSSTATFSMINMIPQSHDLNTMAWESLENYCRDLAQNQGKVCYIIDGPSGQGGTGKNGLKQTTPDGKVTVPNQNWKVVMVLDSDVATAKDLTATSTIRLIAVIMPNADGLVSEDWTPWLTSVNQVEALTGYTFFGDVDPAVINPLKGETDATPHQTTIPHLVRGRTRQNPFPELVGGQFLPQFPRPAKVMPPPPPAVPEAPILPATPTIKALTTAAEGLTYPSESDEPLEVFSWGAVQGSITDAQLWYLGKQDPKARIERVNPTEFFDRLIHPRHAGSQITPDLARRYEALWQTLRAELTDLEVVRIGQIGVVIYIFGRTRDGKVVGIRTAATET